MAPLAQSWSLWSLSTWYLAGSWSVQRAQLGQAILDHTAQDAWANC